MKIYRKKQIRENHPVKSLVGLTSLHLFVIKKINKINAQQNVDTSINSLIYIYYFMIKLN